MCVRPMFAVGNGVRILLLSTMISAFLYAHDGTIHLDDLLNSLLRQTTHPPGTFHIVGPTLSKSANSLQVSLSS